MGVCAGHSPATGDQGLALREGSPVWPGWGGHPGTEHSGSVGDFSTLGKGVLGWGTTWQRPEGNDRTCWDSSAMLRRLCPFCSAWW